MSPQLSLLEPTNERSSNLFFALFPDAETAADLSRLAQRLREQQGLTGKVLEAERFHVSLHHVGNYLGNVPESILSRARQAAAAMTLPAFEVAFDHAISFSASAGRQCLVLASGEASPALQAFHRALGLALAGVGLGRQVKPSFTPHLTLLYDKLKVPRVHIPPVRWTAQELVLVNSLFGEGQYQRLGAWPLRTP